jgi:hypothetical protein
LAPKIGTWVNFETIYLTFMLSWRRATYTV